MKYGYPVFRCFEKRTIFKGSKIGVVAFSTVGVLIWRSIMKGRKAGAFRFI